MKKEIKNRPKYAKLARLIEKRLAEADSHHIRYFRNPHNTIAILDEMGLLKPGLGKKLT